MFESRDKGREGVADTADGVEGQCRVALTKEPTTPLGRLEDLMGD